MTRDLHRQRVYDAEHAAMGGTVYEEPVSWEDLTALFHATLHHPWWRQQAIPDPILRRARHDSGRSSSDGVTVRIARAGQNAITLAHELGHHLDSTLPWAGEPRRGHGPTFCAALLRVVEVVCGPVERAVLHAELSARSVPTATWPFAEPPALGPVAELLERAGPGRLRGAVPLGTAVARPGGREE